MTRRAFPNLAATLFVGPFLAPELGNNGAQAGLGHGVLAKFRGYRNFSTGGGGGGGGDAPTLSAARTATGIKLTFTGTLQSADKVEGPYTDVAGASGSIDVPFSSGPVKFYRAKK